MSRYIVCDVCDQNFGMEDPMAQVGIPASWLRADTDLVVDVCSAGCLQVMAQRIGLGHSPYYQDLDVAGETPDQGDDGKTAGHFVPVPNTSDFNPTGVVIKR